MKMRANTDGEEGVDSNEDEVCKVERNLVEKSKYKQRDRNDRSSPNQRPH